MKMSSLTAATLLALACSATTHAAPLGQLDPKFSGDGIAVAAFDVGGNFADTVTAQAVGPGGSTYVVGSVAVDGDPASNVVGIAKFQHDGKLDSHVRRWRTHDSHPAAW